MDEFPRYDAPGATPRYDENYFERRDAEIKTLRKLSFLSGTAVILYVAIQNGIVLLLDLFGLINKYLAEPFFRSGVDIFMSVLGIMLPFGLFGIKMKKISGETEPIMTGPAKSKRMFPFAVLACTGCVMLANIVSSYFVYFASLIGYELTAPEIAMPQGIWGMLVSFLRVAVLAAVVEEYCLRGAVMGNLRKYGDGFAIMMAAAVFALMHGNLVQAPFALLAGMALGYFTVKTGTIWTAVIAHAINNGLSVIVSYAYDYIPEETANLFYTYALYVLIFVGMFCFFVFAMNTKNQPLKKSQSVLSTGQKVYHFLLTPTTLIAILLMVYITAGSISA